jgi:hypothetical protein
LDIQAFLFYFEQHWSILLFNNVLRNSNSIQDAEAKYQLHFKTIFPSNVLLCLINLAFLNPQVLNWDKIFESQFTKIKVGVLLDLQTSF